jgi:hypothetical protein
LLERKYLGDRVLAILDKIERFDFFVDWLVDCEQQLSILCLHDLGLTVVSAIGYKLS